MDANRISLQIFDYKLKMRDLKGKRQAREERLDQRRKHVQDLEQNLAIVLYKQEEARRTLHQLDAKLKALEQLAQERRKEYRLLVSKEGVIHQLERVLVFIEEQRRGRRAGEQQSGREGAGERGDEGDAAESDGRRGESQRAATTTRESEFMSCKTDSELAQSIAKICEHYQRMNSRIKRLSETFKKKEKTIKNKEQELARIKAEIKQKSSILLKVSETKNTFEEVIKSFTEKSPIHQIDSNEPGPATDVFDPQIKPRLAAPALKSRPETTARRAPVDEETLKEAIVLNRNLLKKVTLT